MLKLGLDLNVNKCNKCNQYITFCACGEFVTTTKIFFNLLVSQLILIFARSKRKTRYPKLSIGIQLFFHVNTLTFYVYTVINRRLFQISYIY